MATKGLNKAVANLKFLRQGIDSVQSLAGYLQAFFGQVVAVPRKAGTATVLSGTTTIAVADTSILATDVPIVTALTKGTNPAYVTDTTVTAGVGFTITVNTDPGAGGMVFNYMVFRLVSHQ